MASRERLFAVGDLVLWKTDLLGEEGKESKIFRLLYDAYAEPLRVMGIRELSSEEGARRMHRQLLRLVDWDGCILPGLNGSWAQFSGVWFKKVWDPGAVIH